MRTNPFKGSPPPKNEESSYTTNRHKAIAEICISLTASLEESDYREIYYLAKDYFAQYRRWSYSDVTNYIFDKSDADIDVFLNNLNELLEYARNETRIAQHMNEKEYDDAKALELTLDKFWDHSNLAQRQKTLLYISDENFSKKFDECAEPYSVKLAKELNQELISLVSIFTALSFLVFGGISSLDNIFAAVGAVPIIELIIVGCIWSFCILNLVFAFVYLVSKLTKLPIRVIDDPKASLAQKYPFWVWSNYFLLLIFAVFCWLYYIDYSNSGSWLLTLSRQNSVGSSIIGSAIILLPFGVIAWILLRRPAIKKTK